MRGSLGVVASRAQCPAEGRRWVSGIYHRSYGTARASGACGIQLCTLTYGRGMMLTRHVFICKSGEGTESNGRGPVTCCSRGPGKLYFFCWEELLQSRKGIRVW